MDIIQHANQHGSKLFSRVTLTHPGDYLAGSATEIALKDWAERGDSRAKLCYAWWPRAQVGAFVFYPDEQEAPSESQLYDMGRMQFIAKYSDEWEIE